MKMFLVVYADASDEVIIDAFKEAGYKSYTKMVGAMGEGTDSEPKLGTHCWPGRNNYLFLAVNDDDIVRLCDVVKRLKNEHPRAGVKAFTLPLEECI